MISTRVRTKLQVLLLKSLRLMNRTLFTPGKPPGAPFKRLDVPHIRSKIDEGLCVY